RIVGSSAKAAPVSLWRVWVTCCTVRRIAPAIRPFEQAAFKTANTGSTMLIIISNPWPSPPSIAEEFSSTPAAVTGDESLPRSPKPSNGPTTVSPGDEAGTSHIVLAPSAASGRDDQT